ncbi:HINT domain-containing protein [Aeoliella sp. ICT_H6.2]|uniref:HINT domain-containing protein n=1 Tax=Aeoliella straminimaris TaxID=2954799 RepID=A0A9X2JHD5_9BACT|nr:HINT domain-containing protein [Aeoliella straminimaris]
MVEEVFTREGQLLEVEIAGRVLRTTPEHPFFVQGQGWTAAGELQPGDLVSTATGEWLAVESITDTHQSVTVYNFRVSEYHTYFIALSGPGVRRLGA